MVLGPWIQKNVSKRLVTMIGIVCQPCKDYGCFRLNHTMNPRYKFSSRKHVAAAAAKSLHSCPTLCDPIRRQPTRLPLSLGFSRQEYWSGLPFPSPMYENEKWKWSRSVLSDSLWPHGLQPTRLVHPWDFPGKSTRVGAITFSEKICYWKAFSALPKKSEWCCLKWGISPITQL